MSHIVPKGIILTTNDFKIQSGNVFINPNKIGRVPGMLLVFANWCGHCKHFIPIFNDISKSLGSSFVCASIESEELKSDGEKLSIALKVQGFPTIKFFDQNGKIIGNYDDNRDKGTILNTICKVYHHCVETH